MPAATVLPARDRRRLTKINAVLLALVMGVGGVTAVVAADAASAAKKPCAGKSCKDATSTSTASPTASPTASTEAAPAPVESTASPTPTAEPTKEASAAPAPSPTATDQATATASPTDSSTPTTSTSSDSTGTWVSPEGVTISVAADVTGWTPRKVYDALQANAYQLALIGPNLKVLVSSTGTNSTSSGAGTSGGVYTTFKATMSLSSAENSSLNVNADRLIAHEYGHVWTLYHLYLSQNKDWTKYLDFRGLTGDSRLDSTYLWDRKELIADDYRLLFGSDAAISGGAYLNRELTDPRQVPGLKDFFINDWTRH